MTVTAGINAAVPLGVGESTGEFRNPFPIGMALASADADQSRRNVLSS